MDLVPQLALLRGRLGTDDISPRNVRLIAVDRTGAVQQHDIAAADDVRLLAAVRIGRGLADQDQPAVVCGVHALVHGGDHRVDVGRGHAFARARPGIAQRHEHDVVGGLHQGELARRLDHALGADDRIGADDRHAGQLPFQPVLEEEAVGLLECNGPCGDLPLPQEIGDELERFLILVPGADLGRDLQHFGDARPLEEGGDDDRIAFGRDDDAGQPLGPPPLDARVIIEARPGFDQHRADSCAAHQRLSFGEPLHSLGAADRRRDRDPGQLLGGLRHHLAERQRHRGAERACR